MSIVVLPVEIVVDGSHSGSDLSPDSTRCLGLGLRQIQPRDRRGSRMRRKRDGRRRVDGGFGVGPIGVRLELLLPGCLARLIVEGGWLLRCGAAGWICTVSTVEKGRSIERETWHVGISVRCRSSWIRWRIATTAVATHGSHALRYSFPSLLDALRDEGRGQGQRR